MGDQTLLLESEMSSKFWAYFGSKNDKDLLIKILNVVRPMKLVKFVILFS